MARLDKYGCACSALIKLAESFGKVITEDEFLSQFESRFLSGRWGLTDTAMICDIARELRLARDVQVYRDYDMLVQLHSSGQLQGLLVQVERFPDSIDNTKLMVLYQCMLLEHIDANEFRWWSVIQDGTSATLPT